MLYSGFNILPRSVIRSANSIARSDNLDVIPLREKQGWMKPSPQNIRSVALGACIPLRFLFRPKQRRVSRAQLPDLKDSAIFHRLWSLFSLADPEIRTCLTAAEQNALDKFTLRFNQLPWEPLDEHPHISQLRTDDLSPLIELGRSLHDLLIRRQNLSLIHI